jgi:hypothetical protein
MAGGISSFFLSFGHRLVCEPPHKKSSGGEVEKKRGEIIIRK